MTSTVAAMFRVVRWAIKGGTQRKQARLARVGRTIAEGLRLPTVAMSPECVPLVDVFISLSRWQ